MMKKIVGLFAMLVLFSSLAEAALWQTDNGSICVSGEGNFWFKGVGSIILDGAGVAKVPSLSQLVVANGTFNIMERNGYTYYSGAGRLVSDHFEGELQTSMGGGSGYLETHAHGPSWLRLDGVARERNVGCIWP